MKLDLSGKSWVELSMLYEKQYLHWAQLRAELRDGERSDRCRAAFDTAYDDLMQIAEARKDMIRNGN